MDVETSGLVEKFTSPTDFVGSNWLRSGYVLWLGAAISMAPPASMPMTTPVINALMDRMGAMSVHPGSGLSTLLSRATDSLRPEGRLDLLYGHGRSPSVPFEAIMGVAAEVAPATIAEYIVRLYATPRGRHNHNHLAVARLLRAGAASVAITTNFDRCIEDAGVRATSVLTPVGGAFGAAPAGLVKVHGSIDERDSLAATSQALARRRNSAAWSDSLLSLIGGRDIVVAGYSMRDWFDIDPVLRRAVAGGSRICYASRSDPSSEAPPVAAWVYTDLNGTEQNLLCALEATVVPRLARRRRATPARTPPARTPAAAIEAAWATCTPTASDQVRIVTGWLHFIEQGALATQLLRACRQAFGSEINDHELGRAYLRARRYRRALGHLTRAAHSQTGTARIRLLCAAGHVAQAGGRSERAAELFDEAHELWVSGGSPELTLAPEVADEFHRGYAENLIHRSLLTVRPRRRARLRARAAWHCRRLEEYQRERGLPIEMAELLPLLRARLALARGQPERARQDLEPLRDLAARWGDPHLRLYVLRMLAFATPGTRAKMLREVSFEARMTGRFQEWLKVTAALAGLDGYGATGPLEMRFRNSLIGTYDLLKEAALTLAHR